jgi:hypothetical protein
LEREQRDAKLKKKFAAVEKAAVVPGSSARPTVSSATTEVDLEVIESTEAAVPTGSATHPSRTAENDTTMDPEEDWHEIQATRTGDTNHPETMTAALGEVLAQATVQSLAQHRVEVFEPWQALTVALHGALRSSTLGFDCFGTANINTPAAGGFAPPVRALPETQFLPPGIWNSTTRNHQVSLRYRKKSKASTAAMMVLTVAEKDGVLTTDFGESPEAATGEPLLYKVGDYVNLESWTRASSRKGSSSVEPSLHFKRLSSFLAMFCQRFDVGSVNDALQGTQGIEEGLPYVDRSVVTTLPQKLPQINNALPTTIPPQFDRPTEPWMREQQQAPTIDSAFGLRIPANRGDFSGDLVPGGLGLDPLNSGSLMGPNHPMFADGHGGPQPPLGMVPRFDPFGPPQPDGLGNNRGGRGRGGPGQPNPDHLRPPNNLNNNNMFM